MPLGASAAVVKLGPVAADLSREQTVSKPSKITKPDARQYRSKRYWQALQIVFQ